MYPATEVLSAHRSGSRRRLVASTNWDLEKCLILLGNIAGVMRSLEMVELTQVNVIGIGCLGRLKNCGSRQISRLHIWRGARGSAIGLCCLVALTVPERNNQKNHGLTAHLREQCSYPALLISNIYAPYEYITQPNAAVYSRNRWPELTRELPKDRFLAARTGSRRKSIRDCLKGRTRVFEV